MKLQCHSGGAFVQNCGVFHKTLDFLTNLWLKLLDISDQFVVFQTKVDLYSKLQTIYLKEGFLCTLPGYGPELQASNRRH